VIEEVRFRYGDEKPGNVGGGSARRNRGKQGRVQRMDFCKCPSSLSVPFSMFLPQTASSLVRVGVEVVENPKPDEVRGGRPWLTRNAEFAWPTSHSGLKLPSHVSGLAGSKWVMDEDWRASHCKGCAATLEVY